MIPAIADAARTRHLLRFRYHGLMRTVMPLAYGAGRSGEELLRAWQVAGPSRSGERRGWKMFRVSAMSEVTPTSGIFTAAEIPPDFNPDDPLLARVFARCIERPPLPRPSSSARGSQLLRKSRLSRS